MSLRRYVMIGGFLGAGKTTAVARLARLLTDQGRRVGLISNDQGRGLVDTALLRSKGFAVAEITGGCFCCRFNSLLEAAEKLTRENAPDIFLAEPVGSCTDLVATVSYPLRRIYGEKYSIAPLSVMVDPDRAARILGLKAGPRFSEKVLYVYQKQLEEADAVFINKTDSIADTDRDRLIETVRGRYPRARVFSGSARDGTGIDDWFQFVLESEIRQSSALQVDYDRYAEGEARLGWLNATVRLEAAKLFDANKVLLGLARLIRDRIAEGGGEIAHLKMTLETLGMLSAVSLVRNDGEPDLRESLLDRVSGGTLVLNLRAEGDPELLARATETALAEQKGIRTIVEHIERFRPARPVPTHRMSEP